MSQSLSDAHDALYEALNVMLTGDPEPILGVWSSQDDVTYAGPFGGFVVGRQGVVDEFRRSAAMELQGHLEVSDVRMVESEAMGYTVCIEHGIDHIVDGRTVNLTHRATNIFRREPDGWLLVHHHTDASAG